MEHDDLLGTCPMGRAFLREVAAARAEGRGVDMTALWKEAGRPRGRSPRHWLAGRSDQDDVRDEGGPDGRVLAGPGTAIFYAGDWLDETGILVDVWTNIFLGALRADPAPMLTKENAGITAMLAKLDLVSGGMTDAEAGQHLIGQVKVDVASQGLDAWAEESSVMHAQRAIGDFAVKILAYDDDGNLSS